MQNYNREHPCRAIAVSEDDCQTWPKSCVLHYGPAAYSCLAVLPDGKILCLYERGWSHPYEMIVLAMFSAEWIDSP